MVPSPFPYTTYAIFDVEAGRQGRREGKGGTGKEKNRLVN